MLSIVSTHQDSLGIFALKPFGHTNHLVRNVCIVLCPPHVPHFHLQLKQAEISWPSHTWTEAQLVHQTYHLLSNSG